MKLSRQPTLREHWETLPRSRKIFGPLAIAALIGALALEQTGLINFDAGSHGNSRAEWRAAINK